MNPAAFSETEAAIVGSLPPCTEFRDVPLRDEPEKYIYISTTEEKKAAGVIQPGDQCWIFRRAWEGRHLKIGQPYLTLGGTYDDGCHFRRPIT